jgi:hypothetical protein
MPFTTTHTAAVLVFARWGLPPSALVIGAIAPDMPMFLPIPEVVHFAHTPMGVVTVDLAIGVFGCRIGCWGGWWSWSRRRSALPIGYSEGRRSSPSPEVAARASVVWSQRPSHGGFWCVRAA